MPEPLVTRCDIAVIGGGPAGIAAACAAGEAGRHVIVLDEGLAAGGQIWRRDPRHAPPRAAAHWFARLGASGAEVMARASVVSVRALGASQFMVTAERDATPLVVSASAVVLATGARERFLPFPGWTLPGVIGVGGAQALLKNGLRVRGRRVLVAGSGPLLLPVAASIAAAGATVVEVAEQASGRAVVGFASTLWRQPTLLARAARYRAAFARATYRTGTWVKAAKADGDHIVATLSDGRRDRSLECDLLCAAFGLVPNTELARELGCRTVRECVTVDDWQRTSVANAFCAGESTGIGGVEIACVEGEIAGRAAAGREPGRDALRRRARLRAQAAHMEAAFALRPELRLLPLAETIVCRCEDVRFGALERSWTSRQAKLYTRAGMGACQGRICGAALHYLFDWPFDTVRPPVQPARVATLLAEASAASAEIPVDNPNA